MKTELITLQLPLVPPDQLQQNITRALQQHGDPLRWAITAVNPAQGTLHIEAVVTTGQANLQ